MTFAMSLEDALCISFAGIRADTVTSVVLRWSSGTAKMHNSKHQQLYAVRYKKHYTFIFWQTFVAVKMQ